MKTYIFYTIIVLLALSKPLLSQELYNKNDYIFSNSISGSGPVITSELVVNDTCHESKVMLIVETDNPPLKYKWSNGSNNAMLWTSTSGIFYVTITDNLGNTVIGGPYETTQYIDNPYLTYEDLKGDCKNQAKGYIHLKTNDLNDIYHWNYDPNQNSGNADNLLPGTYTVTVTEKTGKCSKSYSWDIPDYTPQLINYKIGGISPCINWPDTSGYLALNLIMNNPCYKCDDPYVEMKDAAGILYYWNYNDSNANIFGYLLIKPFSQPGVRKLIFSGSYGCEVDTSINIPLLAELTSNILTSFPDKETHLYSADTQVKGGQAPYSYNWSDGNTQKNRNDLLAGKSYHVTVTDIYGCSSSNNVYVKKLKGENEVNFVNKGDNIEVRTDSDLASENRYMYKLFDVFGKSFVIKESDKTESQWQMNTTNLANGMYYLTAQYDDVIQTFPFVIVRN